MYRMLSVLRLPRLVSCAVSIGLAMGAAYGQNAAPVGGTRTANIVERPGCDAGQANDTCEVHSAVFSAPLRPDGGGHRSLVYHDLNTYGPSINFGNSGGWTVTDVVSAPHVIFGTSGIDQYSLAAVTKNGTGDLAGMYFYVFGGGRAAQSDEGVTGMTMQSGEINGYFHGTVVSGGGAGSTAMTLRPTAGAPHNWNYTCDGCMLLDISKGEIAGSLNGPSRPFGSTYLFQLPTKGVTVAGSPGNLPLTKAWCEALTAIPASKQAGVGTSRTVRCKLGAIGGSTPEFAAGGLVTIAGPFYPEQVPLTDVKRPENGVQSLTFSARNPNGAGAVIFQGGIAGQSLSFDANLAATGFRSSYYVFGSVDGTNLIYGSQIAGDLRSHQLPRPGSEAEQLDSGFHLYPSAEIVANTADPSAPQLEPNSVAWAAGDAVENPRFQSFGGVGIRNVCQQFTPTDQVGASACMQMQLSGPAISGTYYPFRMMNMNDVKMYAGAGGALSPVAAMSFDGPYADLISFRSGPLPSPGGYASIIDIRSTATGDNTPFNLFALPTKNNAGATKVTYDPGTLLVGFPRGLFAGSLATGNCSTGVGKPICGNASSGSVSIAQGAGSVVVTTSAVTANSQILVTADASLDAKLGVTCNKTPAVAFAPFGVSARTPGRGFTLTTTAASGVTCFSFTIIN